jgi:hypothetical protein
VIRPHWIGSPKALLLSVLLLLMGGASAAVRGEDKLPLCRIDRIDGAIASGGFLEITGFAVDPERGTPVQKLEVLLDGALVGESTLSGLRPDVASHFHRQGYLWSGWSASTSLEHISAGKHVIQVKAIAPSGIKASCGIREVEVLAVPSVPSPPAWRIGAVILLRTLVFLLWLGLVGWFPARILGRPIVLLAPLLGLALFAIFAETGGALKVRPIISALCLTAVSGLALLASTFARRTRSRRPSRMVAVTFFCCAVFAVIGAIPLAAHGEGTVLGSIDDAVRECSVADSISRFGWRVPSDIRGYLAAIPANMRDAHIRQGGSYLLSALGDAFGVRAHAVYSVAMLATGVLVILATGLLAQRALRAFPNWRWVAPALVALNSTLLTTLYGQHFGNLLSVTLFTAFLSLVLVLLRSPRARNVWPVALIAAAAFTLYPETTPVWGAAALLTLGIVGSARRMRAVRRIAGAALLAVVLNPVGLLTAANFFSRMTSRAPSPQALGMSSARNRLMTGDTHYFPRLTVVVGLEAYREDAPAPLGTARAILIPAATILILATMLLGWARLAVGQRWLVAALVLPVALALAWMYRLNFPYGFAKLLPLAVPGWVTAFVLLACRAAEPPDRSRLSVRRLLSFGTLVLVAALALPAARHVVARAKRAIPSCDPDFRVLPDMAAARIRRDSVIEIDEPLVARREWIRYFLGEWATEVAAITPESKPLQSERRHYLLLDRRRPDQAKRITGFVALDFALVPVASTLVPAR